MTPAAGRRRAARPPRRRAAPRRDHAQRGGHLAGAARHRAVRARAWHRPSRGGGARRLRARVVVAPTSRGPRITGRASRRGLRAAGRLDQRWREIHVGEWQGMTAARGAGPVPRGAGDAARGEDFAAASTASRWQTWRPGPRRRSTTLLAGWRRGETAVVVDPRRRRARGRSPGSSAWTSGRPGRPWAGSGTATGPSSPRAGRAGADPLERRPARRDPRGAALAGLTRRFGEYPGCAGPNSGVPSGDTARGSRGCGAAGSAPPWHGGGQGFESPQLHQQWLTDGRTTSRPMLTETKYEASSGSPGRGIRVCAAAQRAAASGNVPTGRSNIAPRR